MASRKPFPLFRERAAVRPGEGVLSRCLLGHADDALVLNLHDTKLHQEFFKLFHAPALDAFRLTLPGILLLGRIFSVWDIVAYWLAICIAALGDLAMRRVPGQT